MKNLPKFNGLGLIVLLINLHSCKNKDVHVPLVITSEITNITANSAMCGGTVIDERGSPVDAKGICWSTGTTPTIADNITNDGVGPGTYTSHIIELNDVTTYYVRSYATNSDGTGYGTVKSLKILEWIYDTDGNAYNELAIGTQTWLVENLKTTKYNDNGLIPNAIDNSGWVDLLDLTTGAYCWYNNDANTYKNTYGALYNRFAVMSGKLCPTGWHVPSFEELETLISYIGDQDIVGSKLKESGTLHWLSSNTGATNETGFTALPGGYRGPEGWYYIGMVGAWWSSSYSNGNDNCMYFCLYYTHEGVYRDYFTQLYNLGLSVRCLKD